MGVAEENTNGQTERREDASETRSIWHIPEDELFDMNQYERDQIFDERTNRIYSALTTLTSTSLPEPVRREIKPRIDRILNPELFRDDDEFFDEEP
jgi:hypothetical protein